MRDAEAATSPPTSQPVYLAVGKLLRPHGVRGEILMQVLTDFPERLKPGITVFAGSDHAPLRVKTVRQHDQALLVTFENFTTPEAVGAMRNQFVYVLAADRPELPDGEYYHHQLIGLSVFDEQGEFLGNVIEILETGANDVFVIRPSNGREILLPGTPEVVLKVDLTGKKMIVKLLPGILPDEKF